VANVGYEAERRFNRNSIFLKMEFLVVNHGINKDDLFYNEDNYNFFLKKLKFYICPIAEIYSYSLLPNHFHLMVKIKSKEAIKYIMMKSIQKRESHLE